MLIPISRKSGKRITGVYFSNDIHTKEGRKMKKGQAMVGALIMGFVAIIVALAFFNPIASNSTILTTTVNVVNQTVAAPAAAATSTILTGQAVSGVVAINASSGTVIPASNYTITNYVVSNGQLTSTWTSNAGAIGFQGKNINVTYTYEPYGYATDGGTRAIVPMILIFMALALAIVILVPSLRSGVLDMIR